MKILKLSIVLVLLFPAVGYPFQKYQVVGDSVNVRMDSTVQSASLKSLVKGQVCEVVEKKFDWYKIVLPQDFTCYVWGEFFKRTGEDKGIVKANVLNLRDKPSLESNIIGKAKGGQTFGIVREVDGWVQIKGYPNIYGWVHEKFLQEVQEVKEDKEKEDIVKEQAVELQKVDDLLIRLSHPVMSQKNDVHQALINKGVSIIPQLEAYIPTADIYSEYSIIYILSQLGKDNFDLALDYLMKVDAVDNVEAAGIYLDVVQDIVKPQGGRIPYFYLACEGRLTFSRIKEARNYLHREYNKNIRRKLCEYVVVEEQ